MAGFEIGHHLLDHNVRGGHIDHSLLKQVIFDYHHNDPCSQIDYPYILNIVIMITYVVTLTTNVGKMQGWWFKARPPLFILSYCHN